MNFIVSLKDSWFAQSFSDVVRFVEYIGIVPVHTTLILYGEVQLLWSCDEVTPSSDGLDTYVSCCISKEYGDLQTSSAVGGASCSKPSKIAVN